MQNKVKAVKTVFIVVLVLVVLAGALGLTMHIMRKSIEMPSNPIPSSFSVEIQNFEFGHSSSDSYILASTRETLKSIADSIDECGYSDINIVLDIDTDEILKWELEETRSSDQIEIIVDESDSTKSIVRLKDLSLFLSDNDYTNFFSESLIIRNLDSTQESIVVLDLFALENYYFFGSDTVELSNFELGVVSQSYSPCLCNNKETYAKLFESIEDKGYFDISVQLDCDTDEQLTWQALYSGLTPSGKYEDYFEVIVDKNDSRKAVIRIKNLDGFDTMYVPVVSVSNSKEQSYIYLMVLDFGDSVFIF